MVIALHAITPSPSLAEKTCHPGTHWTLQFAVFQIPDSAAQILWKGVILATYIYIHVHHGQNIPSCHAGFTLIQCQCLLGRLRGCYFSRKASSAFCNNHTSSFTAYAFLITRSHRMLPPFFVQQRLLTSTVTKNILRTAFDQILDFYSLFYCRRGQ